MAPSEPTTRPWPTTYSAAGLVCSIDHLASSAGAQVLSAGGSATDAAIAASAVLAVTSPHMCGMGGDLFALVHHRSGPPEVLDAAGRAGSGADPERLRSEGHREMPFVGDVRSATVPGCVDGWCALHARHGQLPLADVLAPARRLAHQGFPAAPLLAFMLHTLDPSLTGCDELTTVRPEVGERVLRPDAGRMLDALCDGGREAFYEGEFGRALVEVGRGEYSEDDLRRSQAAWVDPLGLRVWDHDVWTVPPVSQGYLSLAGAGIVERIAGSALPPPDEAAWAHLMIEAVRLAGHDRDTALHEGADGAALVADSRLRAAAERFSPDAPSGAVGPVRGGDTMYLCAVDAEGTGVSLIQSNASGFGCHVAVPGTGILLHNRGIGFSLDPGHPAEYGPGRKPPHTLAPALVTRPDGSLRAVLGTMGGDSQPQVVLQLAARLLVHGEEAGAAVQAPRFVVASGSAEGFDTWKGADQVVRIEAHAPPDWASGLEARGHRVEVAGFDPAGFGHAQAIEVRPDGVRAGAADGRAMSGSAVAST